MDSRPLVLGLVNQDGEPITGEDGEPIRGHLIVDPPLVGAIPRPLSTALRFEEVDGR